MTDGAMARLFWRVLDALDYRVMQVRFWLWDKLCGPGSGLMPDEWRKLDSLKSNAGYRGQDLI